MLNNSSRFCLKNNSVANPLTQSQLPIQTYAFKLQNNKPVKLFIRVKNQSSNSRQYNLKIINLIGKISNVLIRKKKDVFEDCKGMIQEVEEYNSNGPSLLEQMMKSEIPVRNGSFMNAGVIFSVIKSSTDLNRSRDSMPQSYNHLHQRNSISNRCLNGLLALTIYFEAKARRLQRQGMQIMKENSKRNMDLLMKKVIHKIAYGSTFNLQTSLMRLKNICALKTSLKNQQKLQDRNTDKQNQEMNDPKQNKQVFKIESFQKINEKEQVKQESLGKHQKSNQNKVPGRRQQLKRLECFSTILQNIDKLKTFETICESFQLLKGKQ